LKFCGEDGFDVVICL